MARNLANPSIFEIYIGETITVSCNSITCGICGHMSGPTTYTAVATWEYRLGRDGIQRRRFLVEDGITPDCGHSATEVWLADDRVGGV